MSGQAPARTVTAVLGQRPVGGGNAPPFAEDTWTARIQLAAWRIGDGPIEQREVDLVIPNTTSERIQAAIDTLADHAIVTFSAEPPTPDRPTFLGGWESLRVVASDPVFGPIAERLRKPALADIPGVGKLRLDRSLGLFSARIKWTTAKADLSVPADGEAPNPKAVELLQRLYNDREAWDQRALDFIRTEGHEFLTESWGDQFTASAEELVDEVRLESLSVDADGESFSMIYDTGETLGDHGIELFATFADGFNRVDDV